jgi:hypothetical protein
MKSYSQKEKENLRKKVRNHTHSVGLKFEMIYKGKIRCRVLKLTVLLSLPPSFWGVIATPVGSTAKLCYI